MIWIVNVVVAVVIAIISAFIGYVVGQTFSSMKYSTSIDQLNQLLDSREDELNEVYENIRKGKYGDDR